MIPKGDSNPHGFPHSKATEWWRQLDAGEVRNQDEIARREGITRARVTQVMGMLRLAPERTLRPIESISNSRDQLREFQKLLV